MAEIALHEDLDAATTAAILKAHGGGHFDLHVKGQLLHRTTGNQMQMAAHGPEELISLAERVIFFGAEHTHRDKPLSVVDLVDVFRDPVQRLQIAQAAFALFHVGFDHIALAALLFVAGVTLFQLGLDKLAFGAFEQVAPQLGFQIAGKRAVTDQIAVFQHRCADGEIFGTKADTVFDRAGRVTDLQLQIPEDIEHGFNHALGPCGDLVGRQEQQIDVGKRGHFTAPVAANSHHGQSFALGRVGVAVQPFGRDLVRQRDQTIGDPRIGMGHTVRF